MTTTEIFQFVFAGCLIGVPTICAALTFLRLVRHRPLWPGVVFAGAFLAGAGASVLLGRGMAVNAENDPLRWWAVMGLIGAGGGSAAAWVALLATRRWTRPIELNTTVMGLWVVAVVLIGFGILGPTAHNPTHIPHKVKRG